MSGGTRAERETGPAATGLSDIVLPPDTHYARSGDVHIAYQVVGERPIDLVYVPSWGSQIEQLWEEPSLVRLLRRLLVFCRLIVFDRRGSGLSDPVVGAPTLEERMDDVRAVLDEVGSRRAALLGFSDGGPMSALFAATYPERTSALVLYGTTPRELWAPDFPWGRTLAERRQLVELLLGDWGHGSGIELFAPSAAEDEPFRRWFARMQRLSASPGTALEITRTIERIDVRPVLPTIRVPTLVLHRTGDRVVPVEAGRHMAEMIPDATYVEMPGDDHLPMLGDSDRVVDEIEEFLTGTHHEGDHDRVLATILFTDIVNSTRRASQLGDRRWRDLLEGHHRIVRRELARFRGREVKTVGDGFLATFDGPARAIHCASAIVGSVRALGIEVRAGLHTGECEVMGEDIGGLAVHIAARVAAAAGPGEVLASRTVTDLVAGSRIEFAERGGARALKGVPGRWQLFAVIPR